jgi:hypothetical protein
MSLKNVSTGGGLVVVGLGLCAIAGAMVVSGSGGSAHAGVNASAVSAVASAAVAQGGGEPTIVWYGVGSQSISNGDVRSGVLFRAWSDGTIEGKIFFASSGGNGSPCGPIAGCDGQWKVFSSPQQGLAAFADLNADSRVDAQDLAQVLSRWGDAPRNDIPPSDCPLNLINP